MFWSNRSNEKRASDGNEKMLKAVGFQTIIAWWLGTLVYQIGSRIETGTLNIANIVIISIIVILVCLILFKKDKEKECARCPYAGSCDKK